MERKLKKIKILYTIPDFDTAGSGKVVFDLVNGLDKNKFAPEICCFHNKGAFFKEVEKLNVPIHIFQFTTPTKPYFTFFSRVNKIASFFKKNNFDIIHSWHWSSDFSEPLAAKLAGVKWVYTKKSMSWGNSRNWKIRSLLSSKIIMLNKDMQSVFFTNFKKKTKLIYIGIDLDMYNCQEKKYQLPNGREFLEKDFVVVTIANLVPLKGVEYLIKAVDSLKQTNIKLLIVGNNQYDYGKKLIDNNKNNKNIEFIDKQLDVRPYLAVADLFVIPTIVGEGLGVAPIEAMASNRIVIGSNVAGIKDVLEGFEKHLFEPKSIEKIAEKINWIMNLNNIERANISAKQRKRVEDVFDLTICIKNHEDFYISNFQK